MPSSWFAVCLCQDPNLLHLGWRPLPDDVQDVLRGAVSRNADEVEISKPPKGTEEVSRFKFVLRYWEDGRFRDAQQINQSNKVVRLIRRFRGEPEHYLRVVDAAKNIVLSTVNDMSDQETTTPKKRKIITTET